MTEDELVQHVEDQHKTIQDQKALLDEQTASIADLEAKAVATPELAPEPVTPAATPSDELSKVLEQNKVLQGTIDKGVLEKEFPGITNWDAVRGDTIETRREHAKVISEMIGAKPGDAGAPPTPDKGEAFKAVPPAGAPDVDAMAEEEKLKVANEMVEAQKAGDLPTVLDKLMKLQPKATANLFREAQTK